MAEDKTEKTVRRVLKGEAIARAPETDPDALKKIQAKTKDDK